MCSLLITSPPYTIAPSKRWPTVCSNPNGKHALPPTAMASDRAGPVTMRSKQQFPLIVQAPYEMHASGECTQRFVYLVPSLEATLASSSTRRSCGKRTVGVLEAHCPHSAGKLSRRAMEYGHRGHGWRLGGIKAKDGGGLLQTVEQGFEQLPHGCQGIRIEQRAHPLPQQALTAQLCPHRLEQGATQLLG